MAVDTDPVRKHVAGSSVTAANSASEVATSEGCPSPLGWAEVLEAFHSQSTACTITSGASVLTYRTLGTGSPLYFLNGISGSSELFCLIVWLLRTDFRCVVFDYPTVSSGRRGRPHLTADGLSADLFAIADAQGDQRFSLFATSFGSVVALTALAAHPKRIGRAILQGGFAHRQLSAVERFLCRLARMLPGKLAQIPFREVIHRVNHQRSFPPFDRSRWSFFVDNAGRTLICDLAERASIVGRFDFRPRLAEIHQGVLLIQSENEGLVSAGCGAELETGLPNARTEYLNSTGHLSYLTHPHRLAKLVREFLTESPESATAASQASCAADSHCLNNEPQNGE